MLVYLALASPRNVSSESGKDAKATTPAGGAEPRAGVSASMRAFKEATSWSILTRDKGLFLLFFFGMMNGTE